MSIPTPPPPAPPRPVGATFFAWIRSLGVTRRDDAWIAGVCSGIAARTGLDPMLVRGIAIVIAVLGGPVFLAYAVGWALLPDSRGHIHAESAVNGHFTYPMIFIGVAAVLTFLPFTRGIWFDATPHLWGMPDWLEITLRSLWALALVAGAIWLTVAIVRTVQRQRATAGPAAWSPDAGAPPAPDAASSTQGPSTADSPTAPADSTTAPPDSATAPADSTTPPPAGAWSQADWSRNESQRERHERAREESRARAAAWREQSQARTAAWRAAHPHPQGPGAAFASVVLGVALVAAAVVGIGYGAIVPEGKLVLVVSIAALVVVAIGIVIAGIRGRTSGGLGPFALLLAIVVVFTGVLPAGTQVLPFGTQSVDVSEALTTGPDSYLLIAGKSVVDAGDLTAKSPDGDIDVWLGAGQTEVILPADTSVRVESHVFAGTVTSALGTERSGILIDDDRLFPSDATGARQPVIRIWLLAGDVRFVSENERERS